MSNLWNKVRIGRHLIKRYCHLLELAIPGKLVGGFLFRYIEKRRILKAVKFHSDTSTFEISFDVGLTKEKYKVGIVIHREIQRNNVWMEHEFAYAYSRSLAELGIENKIYDTLSLSGRCISTTDFEKSLFEDSITHLVLLGDAMLSNSPFIDEKLLLKLRNEQNIVIVAVFMDCLVTAGGEDMLRFWSGLSDIYVIHHPVLSKFLQGEKYILWPSLPYPEKYFAKYQNSIRINNLLIPGSGHRFREDWAIGVEKLGLEVAKQIHTRNSNLGMRVSLEEYFDSLAEYKFVFTNGYRNRQESQVIAKSTEVMLANSLLMYEMGSEIDYFFTPYIHYLPIRNIPDLYHKVSFLQDNPGIADRIISEGNRFVKQKYNSKNFWYKLFSL